MDESHVLITKSICHAGRRCGNCVSEIAGVIERIRNGHISHQADICVTRQLRSDEQVLDNEASWNDATLLRVLGLPRLDSLDPGVIPRSTSKFQGVTYDAICHCNITILFWPLQQKIFIYFWIREDERPSNAWKEDHHKCNNVRSVDILRCDCNHVDRRGIKTWRASVLAKTTSSRRWAGCSNTPLKHPHQISCEEFRYCQMYGTTFSNCGRAAVGASFPDAK